MPSVKNWEELEDTSTAILAELEAGRMPPADLVQKRGALLESLQQAGSPVDERVYLLLELDGSLRRAAQLYRARLAGELIRLQQDRGRAGRFLSRSQSKSRQIDFSA